MSDFPLVYESELPLVYESDFLLVRNNTQINSLFSPNSAFYVQQIIS